MIKLLLALGAAGGNKIPIAINQVAYRYLKQKFRLYDALVMPRTICMKVQDMLKVI